MTSRSDIDAAAYCPEHDIVLRDGMCWRCREPDLVSTRQPQTPEPPAPMGEDDELPVTDPPSRAELSQLEKQKRKFRKDQSVATRSSRRQRPPPELRSPPARLMRAAALGPELFWLVKNGPSEGLVRELRADGLEDLQDLLDPVILEHREILLANAFLVANTNPGPSDWLETELRSLRGLAENHPRAALGLGNAYNALLRRRAAIVALGDEEWEWNDRERRAKRPRVQGFKQGNRPPELFTHMAMLLYDRWHVEDDAKVSTELAARIARVLGWFFEPELTSDTESRIRNRLRLRRLN